MGDLFAIFSSYWGLFAITFSPYGGGGAGCLFDTFSRCGELSETQTHILEKCKEFETETKYILTNITK